MKIRKVKYLWEWHYCFKVWCSWYVWPMVSSGEWLTYEDWKSLLDYEQTRNKITLMTQDEIKKFFHELDTLILFWEPSVSDYKMSYISVYTLIKWLKYTNDIFGIAWSVALPVDKKGKDRSYWADVLWTFLAKNWMSLAFLWVEHWPTSENNYTSSWFLAKPDCIVLAKIWKPSALTKLTKDEANKVKENKKIFKMDDEMKNMREALLNIWYDWWDGEDDEDEDKKEEQIKALPFNSDQWELAKEELDEWLIKIDSNVFTYSWIVSQLLNEMSKMWEWYVCLMLKRAIYNLKDKLQWSLFINNKDLSVIYFPFSNTRDSFVVQWIKRYMPIKVNMNEDTWHIIANELVGLFVSQLFYHYK